MRKAILFLDSSGRPRGRSGSTRVVCAVVRRGVAKFTAASSPQLQERLVLVTPAPAARVWLPTRRFAALFGARPMSRLIRCKIQAHLAAGRVFGEAPFTGEVPVGEKQ